VSTNERVAADGKRLWEPWVALWNGDYSSARQVIAPDFSVHASLLDGSDPGAIRGPEGLVGWIGQIRAAIPDLVFTTQVGPIHEGRYLSGRWVATGTYGGGFPGAQAPVGTRVAFTGTDTLRIEDDRLAEYWLNADGYDLLKQLRVL